VRVLVVRSFQKLDKDTRCCLIQSSGFLDRSATPLLNALNLFFSETLKTNSLEKISKSVKTLRTTTKLHCPFLVSQHSSSGEFDKRPRQYKQGNLSPLRRPTKDYCNVSAHSSSLGSTGAGEPLEDQQDTPCPVAVSYLPIVSSQGSLKKDLLADGWDEDRTVRHFIARGRLLKVKTTSKLDCGGLLIRPRMSRIRSTCVTHS